MLPFISADYFLSNNYNFVLYKKYDLQFALALGTHTVKVNLINTN